MKIQHLCAYEILDSRGEPTILCVILLDNGVSVQSSVPSGKSRGAHEAFVLRDGDLHRYQGKGVLRAVEIINKKLAPLLCGKVPNVIEIDQMLIDYDDTDHKSHCGANALLACSYAILKAQAIIKKCPVYQLISEISGVMPEMPSCMFNLINGGVHASGGLVIQEFMVIPEKKKLFVEQLHDVVMLYHCLQGIVDGAGVGGGIGDEGGIVLRMGGIGFSRERQALDSLLIAPYIRNLAIILPVIAILFFIRQHIVLHIHKQRGHVLLTPLVSLLFGIITDFYAMPHSLAIVMMGSIGCIVSYIIGYRIFNFKWIPALCIYFLGATLFAIHATFFIGINAYLQEKTINLQATVYDIDYQQDNHRLTLHINQIINSSLTKQTVSFYCLAITKKTSFKVGDIIEIKNYRFPIKKNSPGTASFDFYLLRNFAITSLFLTQGHEIILLDRPSWSLSRWWWETRNKLYHTINTKFSHQSQQFSSSLFFGNKALIDQHFRQPFNQWGITHYLARSGLHIALLILMWSFFFSFIPLHITYKRILLISIATLYHFFSWPSISFIRALCFFYLTIIGKLLLRPTNSAHLLMIVALATMIYNPVVIFFLDTQLTFILTATLICLY